MNRVEIIFENNDSIVTLPLKKFLELLDMPLPENEVEILIRKAASSQ